MGWDNQNIQRVSSLKLSSYHNVQHGMQCSQLAQAMFSFLVTIPATVISEKAESGNWVLFLQMRMA